ncbi:MAG: hypothetical protein ABR969_07105 [Sedimentisphaerales bacterium]|jgi:hypothetical protein
MLHYTERKNTIHIITLDRILAEDICSRLHDYPDTASVQLIVPGNGKTITPEDIHKTAHDTTGSKILIMDVRSHTKPRLQQAYSDIARFNRPDANSFCHIVLIGDGPSEYLLHSIGVNAFHHYLADLRTDYVPTLFFADPFLYYTQQEVMDSIQENALPVKIPHFLEKYFMKNLPVKTVYEYFRAAEKKGDEKIKIKKQRQQQLKNVIIKLIDEGFPHHKEKLDQALDKQGCSFPGESLRLNVYPFYFEELIGDFLKS